MWSSGLCFALQDCVVDGSSTAIIRQEQKHADSGARGGMLQTTSGNMRRLPLPADRRDKKEEYAEIPGLSVSRAGSTGMPLIRQTLFYRRCFHLQTAAGWPVRRSDHRWNGKTCIKYGLQGGHSKIWRAHENDAGMIRHYSKSG